MPPLTSGSYAAIVGAAMRPAQNITQPGFGRLPAPNPGTLRYPLAAKLRATTLVAKNWKSKRYRMGRRMTFKSQRTTSHCVRFGLTHILALQPIVRFDAWERT